MLFLKPLLGLFFKDVVQDAAKKAVQNSLNELSKEQIRREFLRTVAEGYTREVEHNLSQYVRALGAASVTIEAEGDLTGDRLFSALQSSLKTLEVEIEKQGENSPIVQYLKRRYGEEQDVYVGRESVSVASMFSPGESRQQVWLNRSGNIELPDSISQEVANLLDQILSEDLP